MAIIMQLRPIASTSLGYNLICRIPITPMGIPHSNLTKSHSGVVSLVEVDGAWQSWRAVIASAHATHTLHKEKRRRGSFFAPYIARSNDCMVFNYDSIIILIRLVLPPARRNVLIFTNGEFPLCAECTLPRHWLISAPSAHVIYLLLAIAYCSPYILAMQNRMH